MGCLWVVIGLLGFLLLVGGVKHHLAPTLISASSMVVSLSIFHSSIITVNGKTYRIPDARNVAVIDGDIFVDGRSWTNDFEQRSALAKDLQIAKKIELHIHPSKNRLPNVVSNVGLTVVHGNAHDVSSDTGDIRVFGDVLNNARSDVGNIHIKGTLRGAAKTDTGDIIHYT